MKFKYVTSIVGGACLGGGAVHATSQGDWAMCLLIIAVLCVWWNLVSWIISQPKE